MFYLLGRRWDVSLKQSVLYCTLGYATHAVLDACTSYGTQLFWPFTDLRVAWDTISVIDPLFTLPILILVVATAVRKNPKLAQLALAWALIYPGIGWIQHERAIATGMNIVSSREHQPLRLEAKPSFGNLLVWKIVYETEDRFFVDAVRMGFSTKVYPGKSVQKLDIDQDFPWLDQTSRQAIDIERFRWFSDGFVARDPEYPMRVIDIRYSMVPNEIKPLWSIQLNPEAPRDQHTPFLTHRTREETARSLGVMGQMLVGD